jgi:septation ring formation regulator EzrA
MINAAMARSCAYKSVGVQCNADAMDEMYDAIDKSIERAANEGKMSTSIVLQYFVKQYLKVELSNDQLKTLAEKVKEKYKMAGFNITVTFGHFYGDPSIEFGWFSL